MSEGRLVQAGTPVELLTRPADDFVRRLIGADAILRQLEYLPISVALERPTGPARPSSAVRLRADATLLEALLALLETGAPALAVAANGTEDPAGYVTLAGLAREITALREAGRPAGGSAPDRTAR
jgi:osmoprotectant transport system ATP-binding protein